MNDLETAGKLRAAAAVLRHRGWCQGDWQGPNGSVCLAQSLVLVDGWKRVPVDALGLAWSVGEWNDQPGRTVDEVLDRLESTALALEVRAFAAETPAESKPELVPA